MAFTSNTFCFLIVKRDTNAAAFYAFTLKWGNPISERLALFAHSFSWDRYLFNFYTVIYTWDRNVCPGSKTAGKVIIKILSHSCYPRNFDWFSWGWSKKKYFYFSQNGVLKKLSFSKPPILNIFSPKKNLKNAFLTCFRPYLGQPDDRIGWATSIPFASIYSTHPRTNL